MLLEPLALEGVCSSTEGVQAVVVPLFEAVIGAVEEEAGVAEELGSRHLRERGRKASEVVAAVAAIAQDDLVRVVILGADLANL